MLIIRRIKELHKGLSLNSCYLLSPTYQASYIVMARKIMPVRWQNLTKKPLILLHWILQISLLIVEILVLRKG